MTTKKRPELGLRKDALFTYLGYQPHAAQERVHRSKAKRRVVACGTRFGKSTLGVYECVAALLHPNDRSLGWLVAPQYELCNRIFLRVVEVIRTRMPHRVAAFEPREKSLKVVNLSGGISELRARSADRPVGLLGEALDWCVLDEAAHLRDDVWSECVSPRLLDRDGWSLMLSTPDGPGLFYEEFCRGGHDADYEVFQFGTAANPCIAPELIEAERTRLTPDQFAAQFLGEFVGVEPEICPRCQGPTLSPAVVILRGDEQPPACPECKGIVDKEGRSAVPLWGGEARVVVIRGGPAEPPEMPGIPSS